MFFEKQGKRIRENALNRYTWDKAAEVWAKRFHEIELKDKSETWLSPPQIKKPEEKLPENPGTVLNTVNFLFEKVLCKPEWIGGHIWRRMLKDLTFGYKCENMDKSFYFNESHTKGHGTNQVFTPNDAFNELLNFRNQINEWEKARLNMINYRKTQDKK